MIQIQDCDQEKLSELHEQLMAMGADPETLTADGFDEAAIGVVFIDGVTRVVYDREKCIEILMDGEIGDYGDAQEYFEFNVAGAHVGPHTPIYMSPLTLE